MSDTPVIATPAAPVAAPTIAQAKADAVKAITKAAAPAAANPGPAPEGKQPVAPLSDLAKLSASNRELTAKLRALEETKDASLKEARDLYAKDKRAGLAKFLAIDDASGELEQLTALFFQAAPGTPEKVEAKNDLESKVAQLEAKAKEDDDNRKAAEEKAKQGELSARQTAAREATLKTLDGFVLDDGAPAFPLCAKNREEAGQHTIQTAVDLASARKIDLNATPDEEVTALLREAAGLVEAELVEIAKTRFAIGVPKEPEPATITPKTNTAPVVPEKVASVPAKPAVVGTNVARPTAATTNQKPHMSVKEAKDTLIKQLRSARHN
jgi:hypothetical protein